MGQIGKVDMGSTVTTGRSVGAFVSPAGKTIYVLFEETYEKNCYPHTPAWSCIAIGGINAVIRTIFEYASSCEGGMLQNRSGHITPEGYIRSWFSELEAPHRMQDFEVSMKVGKGSYSTVTSDELGTVSSMLTSIGRGDIACRLSAGEAVTLKFQKDSDVILAVYGLNGKERRLLAPWRIVQSYHRPQRDTGRDTSLGYSPKVSKAEVGTSADPVFLRVKGQEECFVQQADGSLRPDGWAYRVVGNFVRDFGEEELRVPRSFPRRIKAFRDRVTNAPSLPPEALLVTVNTFVHVEDKYDRRTLDEFKRDFAADGPGSIVEVQPSKENFYRLLQLPAVAARWEIKDRSPEADQSATLVQTGLF